MDSEHVEVDVCFSACVPCDKLPPCKLYTCPPLMVHQLNKLDVISNLASECCETVGVSNKDVVVRSAGWSDGNHVSFWLNGKMIYSTHKRGFTVMLLTPQGETLEPQSFDTNMDSTDFEDFLETLPSNSTILVGVSDEASAALSPRRLFFLGGGWGARWLRDTWKREFQPTASFGIWRLQPLSVSALVGTPHLAR